MSQPNVSFSSTAQAFAVASLVLGILSLVLIGLYPLGILRGLPFFASFVVGVIGVVVGHLARAQLRRAGGMGSQRQIATVGLVLSYAGVILSLALFALVTPISRTVSPA